MNRARAVLRRLRHRARRWARKHRSPLVVFSRAYSFSLPATPVDSLRSEKILTFLVAEELVGKQTVREPRLAELRQLLAVHDDGYLERLHDPASLNRIAGMELPEHLHDRFIEVQRWMTGGTVEAARLATKHRRPVVSLGGGLHHAHAAAGGGFCVFNDVAVAIRSLRADGYDKPILVVDLDLHDGDGTRSIFADDPSVFTLSIHNRHWGSIEAEASTSLALGSDVDDSTPLRALDTALPSALAEHTPDLVFYLAGTDPAADDPLGDWQLTTAGLLRRDQRVWGMILESAAIPVVLLAGGYGNRTWRYTARFLGWALSGRPIEPPTDEEVIVARYRALARLLTRAELSGDTSSDDFGLTDDDLLGIGGVDSGKRFLGFYTAHGIELALEQNGLLEQVRDLGFERPTLEIDAGGVGGDTFRIWAGPDRTELLAEARLRRDRSTFAGLELLAVEWLLLQNPRATFPPGRTALPGQQYPGLGLLRDVVAVFVVACQRLGLDGLLFVPSHYHMAAQFHRYLQFDNPGESGRFRALKAALTDLSLGDASRAVSAGRIRDAVTGELFTWRPMKMILAVSAELTARFEGSDYEEEAERVAASMRYELSPE